MADNVAVTPGAGATIATDEVGGAQYQRIKVHFGADGTATGVEPTVGLPSNVIGMPAATTTTDNLGAALMTNVVMNGITELTPKWASVTVAASTTDSVVIAAVTSKKIRVIALAVQCGATATTTTFESDEAPDVRKHKVPAGANGGQILPPNPWGWFETASGSALVVTTGTGSDTEITVQYIEV
jgi:hypothetical protein